MILFVASIIILILIFSGLIAAAETAITATSPGKIHQLISEGNKRAKIVKKLLKIKDRIISTLLIGNSIANTLSTTLATSVFIEIFGDDWGTLISSVVMSFMIIVFSEVVPKAIAVAMPEKFALASAPIIVIFLKILQPLNILLHYIVRLTCYLLKIDLKQDVSGAEEVRGVIEHHHYEGNVVKDDRDMLGGVLDIRDMVVSELMTHRSNIMSVDIDQPSDAIFTFALESEHSRIPVWQEEPDNIIGILHVRDLLQAVQQKKGDIKSINIKEILSAPKFVPDNALVTQQLNAFREGKSHLACVVDEYGELQGIITLEDILEEIVGQIYDEHDIEENNIIRNSDTEITIEGSVTIRDLNREFDWDLPEQEATTIAGLMINHMHRIPNKGDSMMYENLKFIVKNKSANRIKSVKVIISEPVDEEM